MKLQKRKIFSSIFWILTAIILGFMALLTKTHMAFGGDYLSQKNIKITIFILVAILIILVGASVVDLFNKRLNNKTESKK